MHLSSVHKLDDTIGEKSMKYIIAVMVAFLVSMPVTAFACEEGTGEKPQVVIDSYGSVVLDRSGNAVLDGRSSIDTCAGSPEDAGEADS